MKHPKIMSVVFLGLTLCVAVTHADLFREVKVTKHTTESTDEFNAVLQVYRDYTNTKHTIHLQVDNPRCGNSRGYGTIVTVRNSSKKVVKRIKVPSFEARAMTLSVPQKGRIEIKFLHDGDSGGSVPNGCDAAFPDAYYTVSEPTISSR
jgi:hypothetical protein